MAGLINIVPRYLPGYGMAPEWGRAVRPVVLVYTAISILITIAFGADVNAQAGAYATGILAMMVSGAFAVTISAAARRQARRRRSGSALLTLILLYALVDNVIEKPDGIAISGLFIAGIVVVSLISRVARTTELRADADRVRRRPPAASSPTSIALRRRAATSSPTGARPATTPSTPTRRREQRGINPVPGRRRRPLPRDRRGRPVRRSADVLQVRGVEVDGHRILRAESPAVPNAIAAILLRAARRDRACARTAYFAVGRGQPARRTCCRYLLLGRGDTAPVVREIIRQAEPDPDRRPGIHVGG